jgi:hypothetical protein
MSTLAGWAFVVATSVVALGDGLRKDQELIARAAAQREEPASTRPEAADPEAAELARLERQARIEVLAAQVRLDVVLARREWSAGRMVEAARRAKRALGGIAALPPELDASVWELQAEGILAKAARAGVEVGSLQDAGESQPSEAAVGPVAENGLPPRIERDRQNLAIQGQIKTAADDTAVRILAESHAAHVVPPGEVLYPADWAEKTERRARYRGGQIARSDSWLDEKGREWYVAIYDIHDLTYVPPDFRAPGGLDLIENTYNALDRAALRWRSQIFSGYAEDLAAGLPLLNALGGGVDPYWLRGPRHSLARQQQVTEMIRALSEQKSEAQIISLPPPR